MKQNIFDNNEYLVTILDRLTRLEPAYVRYKRVFSDIINKYQNINAKNLNDDEIINIAENIFTSNLPSNNENKIKNILIDLERKYFKNFDKSMISYKYLSSDINYSEIINRIKDIQSDLKNINWLKEINKSNCAITDLRKEKKLLYPIEKVLLVEGQTELILLKTIFKLFDFDLDKEGYFVFRADGKNRLARKYYELIEYLELPIFILLDIDALEVKNLIKTKLRKKDTIYLLKSGEFEDIIPKELMIGAINNYYKNDYHCKIDDFADNISTVDNLETIHRKYGFGDYKKAKFALILKDYIKKNANREDFKNSEIKDILKALQ